jgi:hypothetical protein
LSEVTRNNKQKIYRDAAIIRSYDAARFSLIKGPSPKKHPEKIATRQCTRRMAKRTIVHRPLGPPGYLQTMDAPPIAAGAAQRRSHFVNNDRT